MDALLCVFVLVFVCACACICACMLVLSPSELCSWVTHSVCALMFITGNPSFILCPGQTTSGIVMQYSLVSSAC